MNLNLKNKTALISGGSAGIGLAIKKALEKEGCKVISWSRSEGVDLMTPWRYWTIQEKFPKFDILINCVGGMGRSEFPGYKSCMEKNYGIMAELTMKFLEKKRKFGRVITIGSIYGTYPGNNPWFAAAKSAQIMFMKSLAGKYPNITFNCVSPGVVSDAGKITDVPLKSKDVANLVTFLCSDRAKYIDGQNIVVSSESVFK